MEDYLNDKEIHRSGFGGIWYFSCKEDWYRIEDSKRPQLSLYHPKTEKCKRLTCLEWNSEYYDRSIPQQWYYDSYLFDSDDSYDEDDYNPFLGFETDPFDVIETFETLDEFKKYCDEKFFPSNTKSARTGETSDI